MEKSNNRVLNELLVNLFHNVMDAEAKAVITEEFKDITNNDIHILEAIGIEEPKSMSRIAGELHVTVGTLTTNMNSLEKKRLSGAQPQHTGQTGGAGDPDREGEKSFFPPQRFPQENDPYDHSGSGRGRNEDIDQMSGKTGYIFQRRQRGVTGEIRSLFLRIR